MASEDTEPPKLQVSTKQESPVKDAVRSLEAQLASEGASEQPHQEGDSSSDATTLQTETIVVPFETVTISQAAAEDNTSVTNMECQQQVVIPQDEQIIIAEEMMQVNLQVAEEQQLPEQQHQLSGQPQMIEQQQQLPGQPQMIEQQQQLPGQPQLIKQQQQLPGQPQMIEQQQQLPGQPQLIQQQEVLPTAIHVESTEISGQVVLQEENAVLEKTESEEGKPIFKCVAVTSDGAPDWSKVMSLNKDILREVLEKHGISMDTSDWPAQKDEDPEARKRRKKAKKAKKKKLKEKMKKSKDDDDGGQTYCDVCYRQFENPGSLKHHQRIHDEDSEGPSKCSICSLVFQRKIGLRAHMRKSHPEEYSKDEENKDEGDYNCEEDGCERIFTTKMGLSQHINQHHKGLGKKKTSVKRDPGDLKCDLCNKTFNLPHKLTQHMVMHSDARPFKCTQCEGTFKHHSSLRTHELIHSNKDACSCPVCGTMFKRAQYVRRHMIRVHDLLGVNYIPPAPVKRYPCEMCHRAYERRSELADHMNSHTGAKPHLCEICAKGFAHKRALDVHRKTHTGKGAFHCDVCNKVFGSKSRMREHRVIHTGEKPFICQQCGSRFAHRANLREHLKSVHKSGMEPLPRGRRKGQRKSSAVTSAVTSMIVETKEMQEPQQQTLQYEVLTTRPHPQIEEAHAQGQTHVIPVGIHQQQPQQQVEQIMYQEIQLQPVVVPGNPNMRSMQVQQVQGGQIEARQDDLASVAQIVLQLHTEGTYTVQ